ncbi:MAG: hypothetical protein NTY53_13810 [Kiritimatiellaeota bacterium]|nr:hypothetical protein [Kiritimatiellota bacterium]
MKNKSYDVSERRRAPSKLNARWGIPIALLVSLATALAGDVQPLMVQRGASWLDESFSGSLDTNIWKVAIGAWKVESGTLVGTERPEDHHPAVIKTPFTNITAVAQFSFMLKGDARLHFGLNDAGGHNSSIQIRPDAVVMNKNADRKNPRTYAPVLDETGAALAPDVWHTMIVELDGADMLARVDDKLFVCGAHPGINKVKTDLALAVSGAALFRNVQLWHATPSPDWPAEKSKLLARQASRPVLDRSGNLQEAYAAAEVKARDRLMNSDEKFVALVDVRACAMEALAKAFPVVNRKGEKADAEKKRLAQEDAKYKQLQKTVQAAQKNERDYLLAQSPEAKTACAALLAANQAKAKAAAAAKK